ncbi:ABC transporter permease [Paenibacillus hamazuiensis]|uniref:ABC transporter permease n=1 Tax=Paenibacillus hamazuiensis TaxID=2936508 RepID=UPI00200EC95F|nr:ABC transporter permease [Paenibacillus hamazuiensis]
MVKRNLFRSVAALVVIIICIVSALFWLLKGHWHDPLAPFVGGKLSPPSWQFVMGTDHLGRDLFSRLLYAAGITLGLSGLAVVLAMLVGVLLGTLAGFNVVPWLTPAILFIAQFSLVFPVRWLPLLIVALLGQGMAGMVLSMVLALWGQFMWIIYDEARGLKGRTFIKAAYLLGATRWGVVRMHVLPHMIPVAAVLGVFAFRTAIGVISTLSFLGIGLQPPTPTWGLMIAEGHPYFLQAWWTVAFPTIALACSVLIASALGNKLELKWKKRISIKAGEGSTEHEYRRSAS